MTRPSARADSSGIQSRWVLFFAIMVAIALCLLVLGYFEFLGCFHGRA